MTLYALERAVVRARPAPRPLRRVLYAVALNPDQKFGSLEEQICFIAHAFRDRGSLFLPLFLCPPGPGKTRQFEDRGVRAECLDLGRFRFRTHRRLRQLIRRERIEVVHWNFTQPVSNPYLWSLTMLAPRVKHYYTDHISRPAPAPPARGRLRRLLKTCLLRRYDKIACVSRFVRDYVEGEGTRRNTVCCPYFVNTDRFRPDEGVRAELRRREKVDGRFVVLTVAHLIREKGVDLALRALAELPADVVLWVAGDGIEAEPLRRLQAELGLEERVRFLGLERNVAPYMQAADCLACPSVWAEAAGLVNLEAQAVGLPVIGSRVGGIPEHVVEGETGLLFTLGDFRELAECIRRLHGDPQLCRRMSQAARAHALRCFSPESRLGDCLQLYHKPI
jgi:glycosyltransferase involved in cell wall biosynthesis